MKRLIVARGRAAGRTRARRDAGLGGRGATGSDACTGWETAGAGVFDSVASLTATSRALREAATSSASRT